MTELSMYEHQIRAKRKTGIPRLLEIAGTKSLLLVAAALLSVIAVFAQVTPFVTMYLLVKELVLHIGNVQAIDIAYVWRLGWVTLTGIGIFALLMYIATMLSHIAAFNILYEIRVALSDKLARLPLGYFTARSTGGIKKVLHEDVERIELFVAHHTTDIVQAITITIVTFIFLFAVDWRLALGALVPILLGYWVQFSMLTSKRGKVLYEQWQDKLSVMNSTIVEYVRGMPVVKIFNQPVKAFRRFPEDVYAYRDLTIHWIKGSSWLSAFFLTLLSSSALFIIPIGIHLVRSTPEPGYTTMVSTVFLFLFIGMGIALPFYKFLAMAVLMVQITTGLSKIDDILDASEIPESAHAREPDEFDIQFSNVSFAYDEKTVLDNVSFSVPEGSVTALVGPSGGGKTTITQLIGRFWDIRSGCVSIGGTDIREFPLEKLNNMVSTVFQEVFLFFDTIEENIRMGNGSASFEQVTAAAKAAQIHDFIEGLPQGYKTLIGEGGTYLSGGEKQRIAIARAILKDAPIIVLDEATAYADPQNEARIQKALSKVLKDKTVIIIAHRLYTITDVDQIVVIHKGRIEESGTHETLLAREGLYKRMWGIHAQARNWDIDTEVTS
ncbi:ABC transporter ATP-binding protein [uncultured Desulfobacter sp.]|uniref:ABC transporter ATP-binding protein n=1 Tax=uncultured Desulfobacter sp. TaxID=240139 RepID=UPI0029C847CF|nr:ABC transporter ATP-binding protein [uncultured Desulfobacter sp.]